MICCIISGVCEIDDAFPRKFATHHPYRTPLCNERESRLKNCLLVMKDCHKFPTFGVYESNLWELPGGKSAPTNQHQTPGCVRAAVRTGGFFFFQIAERLVEEEEAKKNQMSQPLGKTIFVWLGRLSKCMVIYLHSMVNGIGRSP